MRTYWFIVARPLVTTGTLLLLLVLVAPLDAPAALQLRGSGLRLQSRSLNPTPVIPLGPAPTYPSSGKIRLAYFSHVGEKATYSIVMQGATTTVVGNRSQRSTIKSELWLAHRVIAAAPGMITMATKVDSGSITCNGHISPIPMIGREILTKMKFDGAIVETSGFQGLDLKSMQMVFPDRPLGVGDSWTDHLPASSQVPVPLTVTFRVAGFETFRRKPCVKIDTTVRSDKPSTIEGLSLDVKADGSVYFDYGVGRMLLNNVTSTTKMNLKRLVNKIEQRISTTMEMSMRHEYRF